LNEFKEFFLRIRCVDENNPSFNEIEAGNIQGTFAYGMGR